MEVPIMRSRTPSLLVFSILAAGLIAGCGSPASYTSSESATTPTATTTDPQLDAAAHEADLRAREQEVARREAEVVRQQQSRAAQPPTTRPAEGERPPVRHYPRAASEPEQEIVWVTVPASTALNVEFVDGVSSETSVIGDPVSVRLVEDVTTDGWQALPAGSVLTGTVTDAVPTKKIGGKARLSLAFDRIELPSGESVEIQASLVEEGKSQAGKDAATIGGATAGGAILGRVIENDKKGKGTAIGAVVGAAVGTAVAATNKTQPVSFEPGATVSLTLADSVRVSVSRASTPRG